MRNIKCFSLFFLILLFTLSISSQNTIGVISNTSGSLNGYTLFTVHNETYLINNCGEVIHQWTSNYSSGKSVYLLENGNLLRAAEIPSPGNSVSIPGIGGRIELFDWDNNLLWEYNYSTTTASQHHEVFPMPNGNILILAITIINQADAIQMGREILTPPFYQLYNEQILELKPIGSNNADIVWEWNFKDHFIQDFDNTKDNYGDVALNPQLLDINFLGMTLGEMNWLHVNSMQYNADLDQIILSSRLLSEVYIIDHSTTTAEAATDSGGVYQKGGDFLYRWGNPIAYRQGTVSDQKLFGQHFPHWIGQGLPNAGKIILFNNGLVRSPSYSEIDIITPPTSSPGAYIYNTNTAFGPLNPDYIYTAQVNTDFYSSFLSGAQQLPNGNILICDGQNGNLFEIDSNEDIVWQYINPVGPSQIMSQGDDPESITNYLFRAERYAPEYMGLSGRDLTPGLPIELSPDLSQCTIALSIDKVTFKDLSISPNPVTNTLRIDTKCKINKIELYNVLGAKIFSERLVQNINFNTYNNGIYFLKIFTPKGTLIKKIIKR